MGNTTNDDVVLSSRNGLKIAITVYRPDGSTQPVPTIVMGHGIGAIKAAGLSPFAREFTNQGYAAVAFDYISFGESEGSPRNILDVQYQLQDFRDVIKWVRKPEQSGWADSTRVVAWGSSFGGMHVTALMAEDQALAAGIAQCPLVDGIAGVMKVPLARSLKLMTSAVPDFLRSYFAGTKEPLYINLVSDGTSAAVMASKEVADGWARLAPDNGENWPNIIAARSLLSIMFARPILQAHKITRPYLIVLPTWDHEASLDAAEECVRRAPSGEALRVGGGHFDVYKDGIGFEKNIEGQLRFLQRVFGPTY